MPNVTSAEELLASEGLDLVDFSLKLLEKVEESTLYMLQMHDKLGSLEARMLHLEVRRLLLESPSARGGRSHAVCSQRKLAGDEAQP